MAVDQDCLAECLRRAPHELPQHAVIGFVKPLDPAQRLVHRETPGIDFLPIRNDPRDRAEPAGHAHGAGIGEWRDPTVEHPRIEFIRLAVEVQKGAGKLGRHHRRAKLGRRREQRIHIGILGTPQRQRVETGLRQEGRRVDGARMGDIENQRQSLGRRLDDDESGIELVDDSWTHPGHWLCISHKRSVRPV